MVVPVELVSSTGEPTAQSIRPKINRFLDRFLKPMARLRPLISSATPSHRERIEISDTECLDVDNIPWVDADLMWAHNNPLLSWIGTHERARLRLVYSAAAVQSLLAELDIDRFYLLRYDVVINRNDCALRQIRRSLQTSIATTIFPRLRLLCSRLIYSTDPFHRSQALSVANRRHSSGYASFCRQVHC